MGNYTVTPATIEASIGRLLDDLSNETDFRVDRIIREKANELRDVIEERSPFDDGNKTGRHYKDGWRVRKKTVSTGAVYYTIYNVSKPTLTHILEHGRISRKTGKIVGRIPHLYRSYEEVQENLFEALLKLI
jgi:hypothetical protein